MNILSDFIKAHELVKAKRLNQITDFIQYKTVWGIARWNSEEDRDRKLVYTHGLALEMFGRPQFSSIYGNLMLNEGLNNMLTHICASSGTKWDSSNAYLGTGTSATAAAATDTGLLGSPVYKGMMASFPTYGTSQKATWKSEFLSAEANQAWEEFTVSNSNSNSGSNLNRKCSSQGTKVSGQTWELTLEITFS